MSRFIYHNISAVPTHFLTLYGLRNNGSIWHKYFRTEGFLTYLINHKLNPEFVLFITFGRMFYYGNIEFLRISLHGDHHPFSHLIFNIINASSGFFSKKDIASSISCSKTIYSFLTKILRQVSFCFRRLLPIFLSSPNHTSNHSCSLKLTPIFSSLSFNLILPP
jgi:hypothetical protein